MKIFDVIIVGAGPSGSILGSLLVEYGYEVLVIEEHNKIGEPEHCAGILGYKCWNRLPVKPRKAIISRINWAILYSCGNQKVVAQGNIGLAVDRKILDLELFKHAEKRGVRYNLGERVVRIREVGREYEVETIQSCFKSKVLVGADGVNSIVREKLFKEPLRKAMGYQAIVDWSTRRVIKIFWRKYLMPHGFAWITPDSRGSKIGVIGRSKKQLQKFLKELGICNIRELIGGPVPLEIVNRSAIRGALLIGDAAGQVKPFSRGGIYFITLCAPLAARVIDEFLKGRIRGLEKYDMLWRRVLRKHLLLGEIFRLIINELHPKTQDLVFKELSKCGKMDSFDLDDYSKVALWALRKGLLIRLIKRRLVTELLSNVTRYIKVLIM